MPVPELHRAFVERSTAILQRDARVLGVAVAGSWIAGEMDEHSDLDLVLCVADDAFEAIMGEREALARSLGDYLVGFTGEHVGEPRLLICLYGPPLLHVDLKFVGLADFDRRVENPHVVWERNGALTSAMASSEARWPPLDRQWIEDRFWVWIHYAALKVARGELFEAMDFLAFLRSTALGPMVLVARGQLPRGVRKLELHAETHVAAMLGTVAAHDAASCVAAIERCIVLYSELRADGEITRRDEAEAAVRAFVDDLARSCTR